MMRTIDGQVEDSISSNSEIADNIFDFIKKRTDLK
jgi:hypothetical protein